MKTRPTPNQRLRQARRRLGITQTELAAMLGVHQTFVSLCERGEVRIPLRVGQAMEHQLGLTPGVLNDRCPRCKGSGRRV